MLWKIKSILSEDSLQKWMKVFLVYKCLMKGNICCNNLHLNPVSLVEVDNPNILNMLVVETDFSVSYSLRTICIWTTTTKKQVMFNLILKLSKYFSNKSVATIFQEFSKGSNNFNKYIHINFLFLHFTFVKVTHICPVRFQFLFCNFSYF